MYNRPMSALAIIMDDRPANEETHYSENTYETRIDYRVLDYCFELLLSIVSENVT